jgi:hypothetical protein
MRVLINHQPKITTGDIEQSNPVVYIHVLSWQPLSRPLQRGVVQRVAAAVSLD